MIFLRKNIKYGTAAELNDADNPHGCWFDRTIT